MITSGKIGTVESMFIDPTGVELHPVEFLADYRSLGASGVIDFGTFTAEETEELERLGIAEVNSKFDGWTNPELMEIPKGPACSCCMKKMEDGSVIMGRNMDLPSSYSPAIIFRTKGNGKDTYDTVNLAYSHPGPITYDQIALMGGFPKFMLPGQIMVCCDSLNSEGLYLQYDMRESAGVPTESTNPNGKIRTCCMTVARLMADRCATVEEALRFLGEIDVYDPKSVMFDWSMAVGMMDKTGRYGVLEFVKNKIIFHEGRPGFACGQGNFYWDRTGFDTGWGQGLGRWMKLMEHYNDIETVDDMEKAIQRIWYSNLFTDGSACKDWKVDWVSEMQDKHPNHISTILLANIYAWREQYGIDVDEKELKRVEEIAQRQIREGIVWNNDYLSRPESYYDVITVTDLYTKSFFKLPIEARKMTGFMEISTFSYVADTKKAEYRLHIFQTNDVYHVGVHETVIDRIPTEKLY